MRGGQGVILIANIGQHFKAHSISNIKSELGEASCLLDAFGEDGMTICKLHISHATHGGHQ
jgi:hypothetical protein